MESNQTESKCICRKCQKEVNGLTSGLCSDCVPKVSFMEFWQIQDPEEATRTFFLQQLNKSKMAQNKKEGKKPGEDIYEELPLELEMELKEGNSWEEIKKSVQEAPKLEELPKQKSKGKMTGKSTKKQKKGVQEWACKSVNLQYGCENNCTYCYAKRMAQRFNRIPVAGWEHPILKNIDEIELPRNTTVMFPSTHDITESNLDLTLQMIYRLLTLGNKVLIVSKPRLACIQKILLIFDFEPQFKNQIEFRFTIGSCNNETLKYWEPNAPSYNERMAAVDFALSKGFTVSISCEPLLDNIGIDLQDNILGNPLIDCLLTKPVKEIWIGAMKYTKNAPKLELQKIFAFYKNNPMIRWKDSFIDKLKQEIKKQLKPPKSITQTNFEELKQLLSGYPVLWEELSTYWSPKIKD